MKTGAKEYFRNTDFLAFVHTGGNKKDWSLLRTVGEEKRNVRRNKLNESMRRIVKR